MAAPAPRMTSCHKRLPEFALEARRRLAAHLRPAVCRLSTDESASPSGTIPRTPAGYVAT
ncbi:hypothetical protein ASF59_20165 [Methylobacterium sp. Leaf121]|nr:hypothetical protein ASF59_20165 [Methylobacterium sp. Leaf121]